MRIQNMFSRDIDRKVNGVIKADQAGEEELRQELEEYVITDEVGRHLRTLLAAYEGSLKAPTDRIGVWISGFFGSGKSHFLKMLSYLLPNRVVAGTPAQAYFEPKLAADPELASQLGRCLAPTCESVLFNIDNVSDINRDKTSVLRAFAQVFFDHLGYYGKDLKLAKLEEYVDAKGKTEAFRAAYERIAGEPWVEARPGYVFNAEELTGALAEAGVMSEANAQAWVDGSEQVGYSVDEFTDDVRAYVERRRGECGRDFRLLFMVDEIGQYIGDDAALMLNLQTIVEELGAKCQGAVWVMVTSQEAIDAVTKNIKGADFSKIQGRFPTRLSFTSSSVDEVIRRRILEKNEAAADTLASEYAAVGTALDNVFTFESARGDLGGYEGAASFSENFPFVPYQFDLVQSVFNGLRATGSSGKNLSSGERSMLSAFQESAQAIEEADERALVPMWRFYDTLSSFLESYISGVVARADEAARAGDQGLMPEDIPVLKVLLMLRYARSDMKATIGNLKVLMVDSVDADMVAIASSLQDSLDRLVRENYVSRAGDVYSFLTNEEQEIAAEISRTEVDVATVTSELAKIVFETIFPDTKATVGKNGYTLQRCVDAMCYSGREGELVLRVVSDATPDEERSPEALLLSSANEGSLVVGLADKESYFEGLRQAAKVDRYCRTRNLSELSDQARLVVEGKRIEHKRLLEEATAMLERAIADGRFFAAGTEVAPKGNAAAKLASALESLVERRFPRRPLIERNFEGDADITSVLMASESLDDSLAGSNPQAVAEVSGWLATQAQLGVAVSMGDVQRTFQGIPYGWRQIDIACVVAQLAHDRKVDLLRAGVKLALADAKMPRYLRVASEVDQVQVRVHVAIDPRTMRIVKDVYKELAGTASCPGDEEGLDQALHALLEKKRVQWSGRVEDRYAAEPRFPGKEVLERGTRLLGEVLAAGRGETKDFFASVCAHEDDLLELADEVAEVDQFFSSGQEALFSKALKLRDELGRDVSYLVVDSSAVAAMRTIDEILKLDAPYRRIQELGELCSTLRSVHDALLQRHVSDFVSRAEGVFGRLGDFAAEQGVAQQFEVQLTERRRDFEGEARHCSAIADVEAMQPRLESYEAGASEAIRREAVCARRPVKPLTGDSDQRSDENPPTPDVEPTIAYVSRSQVLPPTPLSSPAEVDAYVERLRAELLRALENHNFVQLKG